MKIYLVHLGCIFTLFFGTIALATDSKKCSEAFLDPNQNMFDRLESIHQFGFDGRHLDKFNNFLNFLSNPRIIQKIQPKDLPSYAYHSIREKTANRIVYLYVESHRYAQLITSHPDINSRIEEAGHYNIESKAVSGTNVLRVPIYFDHYQWLKGLLEEPQVLMVSNQPITQKLAYQIAMASRHQNYYRALALIELSIRVIDEALPRSHSETAQIYNVFHEINFQTNDPQKYSNMRFINTLPERYKFLFEKLERFTHSGGNETVRLSLKKLKDFHAKLLTFIDK